MDKLIADVLQINTELLAACSQVPFREKQYIAVLGETDPHANIEFAFVNEQWFFDVLLNDERIELNSALLIVKTDAVLLDQLVQGF